jgi:hypothetical protein
MPGAEATASCAVLSAGTIARLEDSEPAEQRAADSERRSAPLARCVTGARWAAKLDMVKGKGFGPKNDVATRGLTPDRTDHRITHGRTHAPQQPRWHARTQQSASSFVKRSAGGGASSSLVPHPAACAACAAQPGAARSVGAPCMAASAPGCRAAPQPVCGFAKLASACGSCQLPAPQRATAAARQQKTLLDADARRSAMRRALRCERTTSRAENNF